jgi:hypothetical protein
VGVTLPDGRYIRGQRPMPPQALARCLDPGLTPADWYALLNGCVFFWLDPDRVDRPVRAASHRPAELVLRAAVPDAMRFVIATETID